MRIERFSRGSARFGTEEQETGLKPLNGFRLKAGLRREGSPAQNSLSEYRLQPEVSEGLQARVLDGWVRDAGLKPLAGFRLKAVLRHGDEGKTIKPSPFVASFGDAPHPTADTRRAQRSIS